MSNNRAFSLDTKHTRAMRTALAIMANRISDVDIMAIPSAEREKFVTIREKALEGDLHTATEIADFAIMYTHDAKNSFIFRQAFSSIGATKREGKIKKFSFSDFSRSGDVTRVEPGVAPNTVDQSPSTLSWRCEKWAVRYFEDRQTRNAYPSTAMADKAAAALLTELMMLTQEVEFFTDFVKTGVWGTDATPGTKFDAVGGDVFGFMQAQLRIMQKKCKRWATDLTFGPALWDYIVHAAAVTGRLSQNDLQVVRKEDIAALLQVKRVHVADSVYETAGEGLASVPEFSAGAGLSAATDFCLATYRPDSSGIDAPEAGKIISYSDFDKVAMENGTPTIVQYDHWDKGVDGIFSHAEANYDILVTAAEAGLLMYDTLT